MEKQSFKVIVGVPLLLLCIAVILSLQDTKPDALSQEFNPYLEQLPIEYEVALNAALKNDSTYFVSTSNNYEIRKLLIFKRFPNDIDLKTDFTLNLYPKNRQLLPQGKSFITYSIVRDATVFKSQGKAYGVFKVALPLIDIDTLRVIKKVKIKSDEPWEAVIKSPFKNLRNRPVVNDYKDSSEQKKPMLFSSLFTNQLDNYNIKYLPSSLGVKENKVYRFYQPVDDFVSSHKIMLVKVINSKRFWRQLNSKSSSFLENIEFIGDANESAKIRLDNYINENDFGSVFDVKKLAYFNALKPFFNEDCGKELYFIYNSETALLEPFHAFSNCTKENTMSYMRAQPIEDDDYLQAFNIALNEVSQINLYSDLIKSNNSFVTDLALINDYDPNHIFDFDMLRANQRVLKKSLNPSSALKCELISMTSSAITLSVFNTSNYTIDILELNHKNKNTITSILPAIQVKRNQRDTLTIDLPRSFENLFVSKKKKRIGFVLPKHIYQLNIRYRFNGLDETHAASIIPYQKDDKIDDDLFRSENYVNNHKSIVVDEEKKEVTFLKDSVVISSPLVIDKNYTFVLNAGAVLNIVAGGKIISHSPLRFIGTKDNPIIVHSIDKKGQGLLVMSDQRKSVVKHAIFDHLTNPTHGSWGISGAVTFYESPVDLFDVSVKNNTCEDALNIVRATFTMDQVSISNTQSDAFDGDYVKGTIRNCKFDNLGNDAIDVSGSDLVIRNVAISNAGDKGLSAGEQSKMTVDTVEIFNSEIGVAGKDLSEVYAKNLKIINTTLGFTAFQKKPEFGPSKIKVDGVVMRGIETKYLIESSSLMLVDNKKIETTENVKDRMYGVEFGISSDETRNTSQK